MATTEASQAGPGRPRPWLLVAFGIAVVLFAATWFWPVNPAPPAAGPSNAPRPTTAARSDTAIDPEALDVRLDALEVSRDFGEGADRNPFRFQPKPEPVRPVDPGPPAPVGPPPPPPGPVGPPPPPPIGDRVKFIGIVEKEPGLRVAAFSDCRMTTHAAEGGIVFGQYRLVKIQVETVVMEYLDGRGRTTIRLSGAECVGK
jgi:hypothetical protein